MTHGFEISLSWYDNFSTEDVERSIEKSLKKELGDVEVGWTLYANGGIGWEELALSRSMPSGKYRLEYEEVVGKGKGATKRRRMGVARLDGGTIIFSSF